MSDRGGGHARRGGRWSAPVDPPGILRLFFAVPVPGEAREHVGELIDRVQGSVGDGTARIRWVRVDGLHLTLRFLGPTAEDRVEPTAAAVRAVASAAAGPIDLELGGAGTFPPHGRPRALWIGIVAGAEALTQVAMDLNTALADAGWERDDRPFRAHLTLARSDGVPVGTLVADRLASVMADRRIAARVDSIGLFETVTGGGPARYVPVTSVPLGPEPDETAGVYHQPIPGAH